MDGHDACRSRRTGWRVDRDIHACHIDQVNSHCVAEVMMKDLQEVAGQEERAVSSICRTRVGLVSEDHGAVLASP